MAFQDLLVASRQYFPNLRIKYKDQSFLMKLLSTLLFFRKDFMSDFTVLCGTIYIPSQHFLKVHPVSSIVLFLYELSHLHLSKKKACLSSLYVIRKLSQKMHFKPHLEIETKNFVHWLHKPWLRTASLEEQFQIAIQKIQQGDRPYVDPIFDILDDLINKV